MTDASSLTDAPSRPLSGSGAPAPAPAAGVDTAPLKRAARWHPAEFVFWLLPVAGWFAFPDDLALLTQIAITALFALSLDIVLGYAGMITLGHAAFFGLGAYAAGMMPAYLGIGDPLLGLLAAALVAGLGGVASSYLVLRGTGLTRLMVTVGLGMMLYEAANKASGFTGGVDGLAGVEMAPVIGLFEFDLYGRTAYVYAMVVLFVLFVLVRRIVMSPFGLSLKAIHQNETRMPALGVCVNTRLRAAWTLGAVLAGVAGALLTQTTQFVALDVLGFPRSAEILLILILGGAGRLYGALVGTVVFLLLHHVLADLDPEYWQLWIGLILIGVVLFARDGILGGLSRLVRRLAPRRMRP